MVFRSTNSMLAQPGHHRLALSNLTVNRQGEGASWVQWTHHITRFFGSRPGIEEESARQVNFDASLGPTRPRTDSIHVSVPKSSKQESNAEDHGSADTAT
jgi:hypothetical protein